MESEYTDIVMKNTLSPPPKILTNDNTKLNIHYFTQWNSTLDVEGHSARQQIPCHLQYHKDSTPYHNRLLLDPTLSQLNPVPKITYYI
jgi:hypothetical protein